MYINCEVKSFSRVQLFVVPWTVVHQVPPSMEFSRQDWSGCHFLLQGICPAQGSNPGLPHFRQTLYHLSHQGRPNINYSSILKKEINHLFFFYYILNILSLFWFSFAGKSILPMLDLLCFLHLLFSLYFFLIFISFTLYYFFILISCSATIISSSLPIRSFLVVSPLISGFLTNLGLQYSPLPSNFYSSYCTLGYLF